MAKVIKSIEEFEKIITSELSPGGKILIYIYEDATPAHFQLDDIFEKSAL